MDLLNYKAKAPFAPKHMLNYQDYTRDEIYQLLSLALKLKAEQKAGIPHPLLRGKSLGMIFTKASTRTRVSFEVGMYQLGGQALFLSGNDIQLHRGESIADTAQVLSRFLDGIMIRTFAQSDAEDLARYGTIPIINGLTDDHHPCQVLADLMTMYEHKHELEGLKLAFIGDGNNMAHSLLEICSKVGMDVFIASPEGYQPNPAIVNACTETAKANGSEVVVTADCQKAIAGADVVYTDVWASMGQEAETQKRIQAFQGYQVNGTLFAQAKPDALFLHCLPAHRGEEVTADVIDGPNSVVFDEAENRLHAQKAVMAQLMGGVPA